MTRVSQIVLVCEDWRQSVFARGFLDSARVGGRVYEMRNPGGSGHDWVKTQFVLEVENLSRFAEGRGVLGLIDEDGQGVVAREGEITARLKKLNLPALRAAEGKCLLIPARNIETWLRWLNAHENGRSTVVDEITDYKRSLVSGERVRDQDCRPAGLHLHTLDHTSLPSGCPGMLGQALERLREFLKGIRR